MLTKTEIALRELRTWHIKQANDFNDKIFDRLASDFTKANFQKLAKFHENAAKTITDFMAQTTESV